MSSLSFHATEQLENRLSNFYEYLYNKENKIAQTIEKYRTTKKRITVRLALFSNVALNILLVVSLFNLLC